VNVGSAAAPYLTLVAIATAEIPGLDVVTASLAAGADACSLISSAWNTWHDVDKDHWGALKTQNFYLDAAGVGLSLVGAGGMGRVAKNAANDAKASRQEAVDVATASRRKSGNSKAVRNQNRAEIKPARQRAAAASGSAEAAAQDAEEVGTFTGKVSAIHTQTTNEHENSWNPISVFKASSWEPLW